MQSAALAAQWQLTALPLFFFFKKSDFCFSELKLQLFLNFSRHVRSLPPAALKWPLHCEKMRDGIYGMSAQGQVFVHAFACAFFFFLWSERRLLSHFTEKYGRFDFFDHRKRSSWGWLYLFSVVSRVSVSHLDCKFLIYMSTANQNQCKPL